LFIGELTLVRGFYGADPMKETDKSVPAIRAAPK
jgi:hypothetical protein